MSSNTMTRYSSEHIPKVGQCCLCQQPYEQYGNNPWPLVPDDDISRCCNDCNITKVVPARLLSIFNVQRDG